MVIDPRTLDNDVRVEIARSIREDGRIPTIADVSASLGLDREVVDASFARLIDAHVFTPAKASREIHAYHPFCVGPTGFRARAGGREWWAICAWDALGVPASLGTSGTVEARCGDCGEAISVEVGLGGTAKAADAVVLGMGVAARDFWKDIYFT